MTELELLETLPSGLQQMVGWKLPEAVKELYAPAYCPQLVDNNPRPCWTSGALYRRDPYGTLDCTPWCIPFIQQLFSLKPRERLVIVFQDKKHEATIENISSQFGIPNINLDFWSSSKQTGYQFTVPTTILRFAPSEGEQEQEEEEEQASIEASFVLPYLEARNPAAQLIVDRIQREAGERESWIENIAVGDVPTGEEEDTPFTLEHFGEDVLDVLNDHPLSDFALLYQVVATVSIPPDHPLLKQLPFLPTETASQSPETDWLTGDDLAVLGLDVIILPGVSPVLQPTRAQFTYNWKKDQLRVVLEYIFGHDPDTYLGLSSGDFQVRDVPLPHYLWETLTDMIPTSEPSLHV